MEDLGRAATSKIDLRFEHDLKTGLHDVDLGIKTPNNSNQYIEAYQFKTKKQGLRTSDIADASKQLKEVISQKKIVEIKCLDGVTAETLGLPEIIREMKFQAKLIDPLKGAGIHEFHFILPNGTKVIKITSFL